MGHILPSPEHLHVAEAAAAPWWAGQGLFKSGLTAWEVKCFIRTLLRIAGCFGTCLSNWWLPADGADDFALIWDSISTTHGYLWYYNGSLVGESLTAHMWVWQQGEVPGWLLNSQKTLGQSGCSGACESHWRSSWMCLHIQGEAQCSAWLHTNTDLWVHVLTHRITSPCSKQAFAIHQSMK